MSYRVVVDFADRTDSYYVYHAGDLFPRIGKQVNKERISELSGKNNAINKPIIEEVVEEKKKTAKVKTKE